MIPVLKVALYIHLSSSFSEFLHGGIYFRKNFLGSSVIHSIAKGWAVYWFFVFFSSRTGHSWICEHLKHASARGIFSKLDLGSSIMGRLGCPIV